MINVKTSWNMFRMQISTQTDDHNFRKNGATDKKYILRNNGSKFQSHKFKVLCKIALCKNPKWLNKVMFQFLKKLYTKLVPKTVHLFISIFLWLFVYHCHLQRYFLHWTSSLWITALFVKSISGLIFWKCLP